MLPEGNGLPTVVTHLGGSKFAIRIRSHEIIVDQTIRGGGTDSAPTPLELLGASLGSCIGYYVSQFLMARHLPVEGLRVEVVQTKTSNPSRVESFAVHVMLPDRLPAEYAGMIGRVVKTCPAHNTLAAGAVVNVDIGQGALIG